jgi:hypothetical protein
MNLLRYFYIDELGLASLHAQLTHGEVTESVLSSEHTDEKKRSLKLNFLSLIGAADMEGAQSAKEAMIRKLRLRAENRLREICASLRATGQLHTQFPAAATKARSTGEPAWFYGRQEFCAPQFAGGIVSINQDRAVVFTSGENECDSSYNPSDEYYKPAMQNQAARPRILMSASLFKFPGAQGGQLGVSSHEALFFSRFATAYVSLLVFGSVYCVAESYQIKPLALSV